MQFKTITAKDMTEAMDIVRRTMGDSAIIVSSVKDPAGIKVTAALDSHPGESSALLGDESRGLNDDYATAIDVVGSAFDYHRVPRRFGDKILDELEATELDDPVMALAAVLESRYGFKPLKDSDPARPMLLVGPPGVGKTSLTAKIGTWAKMRNQPCQVVTTDTYKAGATEQLRSYTDIMGQDLHVAQTPEMLADIVLKRPEGHMSVIDTVGINPFLEEDLKILIPFVQAIDAEPVLVLSAGGDAIEAGNMARIFKELGVERFLYTRMDISQKFASLLTIADRGEFSFADASISPLVAEGFNALNPVRVAKIFLEK